MLLRLNCVTFTYTCVRNLSIRRSFYILLTEEITLAILISLYLWHNKFNFWRLIKFHWNSHSLDFYKELPLRFVISETNVVRIKIRYCWHIRYDQYINFLTINLLIKIWNSLLLNDISLCNFSSHYVSFRIS